MNYLSQLSIRYAIIITEQTINQTRRAVRIMKSLTDCKEYFRDLYMDCLEEKAFGKSQFDITEKAKFETFCETLKFIYGEQFTRIEPTWTQESLDEFYSR